MRGTPAFIEMKNGHGEARPPNHMRVRDTFLPVTMDQFAHENEGKKTKEFGCARLEKLTSRGGFGLRMVCDQNIWNIAMLDECLCVIVCVRCERSEDIRPNDTEYRRAGGDGNAVSFFVHSEMRRVVREIADDCCEQNAILLPFSKRNCEMYLSTHSWI